MYKYILFLLVVLISPNFVAAQNDNETTLLDNAQTAKDNNDYEQAIKWYKKAIVTNNRNGETYYNLTWCMNELALYDEAEQNALMGLKIMPNSAKLLSEYGYTLYMLGKYTAAIEKYKRALAIDPENSSAILGMADASFEAKDNATAETYYKKYLKIGKNISYANYKLGYIMNDFGKYAKAVEYEMAALKLNSEYAEAYNELGYAYNQLNQPSLALDNYKKASNLNPKNATYYGNVADMYYSVKKLEDLDKALEYYKKSVAINDKNAIFNYRIGWILNEKEKYTEAKPYLITATNLDAKYADAWLELGWAEYSLGNNNKAEDNFKTVIKYNQKSELARYYLGILYLKQQKRDKVRDMIGELIEMSSKYADKLKEKL